MSEKSFSWVNTIHKAFKCPERRFNFWWRIASFFHDSESKFMNRAAYKLNLTLIKKYNTEIQLGAHIGPGLKVTHFLSVAINKCAVIGCNFKIRHNSTIGIGGELDENLSPPQIIIGDNVEVGVGSCIIGNYLTIGNNVSIGAMSFINKNIPNNTIVYTEKTLIMKEKSLDFH